MKERSIKGSFGTHNGTFHADEVTACALLINFGLVDEKSVMRTRDPRVLDKCEYVCDVGGFYDPELKLFDHHQADYQGRLSSAGMVLHYLKDEGVLSEEEYRFYDQMIVAGVDDHDNGRDPQLPGVNTYSHIISNFMPISYEATDKDLDSAFFKALQFVKEHLKRLLKRFHYTHSCTEIVAQEMKKKTGTLFFEKSIPWMDSFFELGGEKHPACYVVMPTGKHWKLRGIPPNSDSRMQVRFPLPKSWAGLLEEDLKQVTGIQGAIFCHKGLFISVWETKEDVLKALKLVLES